MSQKKRGRKPLIAPEVVAEIERRRAIRLTIRDMVLRIRDVEADLANMRWAVTYFATWMGEPDPLSTVSDGEGI